ncbi:hypothetical protein Megpolyxen_01553 (plasmid) [Candidatus Megaera polyxenophila]|nr:hypothetical protein Megpolyxen_01553 [Candidatus Megaera polyxenophila]
MKSGKIMKNNNRTEPVKKIPQLKDIEAIRLKDAQWREEAEKKRAEGYARNEEIKKYNEEIKKWLHERNQGDKFGEGSDGYGQVDYDELGKKNIGSKLLGNTDNVDLDG